MELNNGGTNVPLLAKHHHHQHQHPVDPLLSPNEINQDHFRGDFSMEDSPCYEVLSQHNLLTTEYRVANERDLVLAPPNSNRWKNIAARILVGPLSCCLLPSNFEVPNGCVRTGTDGRGNFVLFGPGVHQVLDPFYSIGQKDISKY